MPGSQKMICLIVGAALLVLFPQTAWAEIKWGRIEVHPGLALTAKYNDNVFLEADKVFDDGTSEGREEDLILSESPSLQLIRRKEGGDFFGFQFNYVGIDEHFIDLQEQDIFKHDLFGNFSLGNPAGAWELKIGARHFITRDPISSEFGSNFNPRVDRKETHATGDLDWQLAQTLRLDLITHFKRSQFSDIQFQFETSDTIDIGSGVYWQYSPLTLFEIKYKYQLINYLNVSTINFDARTNTVQAGMEWKPNSAWRILVLPGVNNVKFEGIAGQNRSDFVFEAEVEFIPSKLTRLTLYGFRRIKNATFDDIQTFDKTGGGMTLYRQLALKWFAEIQSRFEVNDYDVAAPDPIHGNTMRFRIDELLLVQATLTYKIQQWWQVRAMYRFVNNWSNFDTRDYRNHVGSLTLSFKF